MDDILKAAHTVMAVSDSLPTLEEFENLRNLAAAADKRGYFDPEEDDVLRSVFAKYIRCRTALIETIEDLRPLARIVVKKTQPERPEVFIVAYSAAVLLTRSAYLLIDACEQNSLATKKLNEAEPRFRISRKQFTRIYKSSTSPLNIWAFIEAQRYWNEHKEQLSKHFATAEVHSPVYDQIIALIDENEPWIDSSKHIYASNLLKYRIHSFLRRQRSGFKQVTFVLFKVSGRLVSELNLKWIHKRKRVTPIVQRKLAKLLQPGDVIVTRHDDAATNLFLPGFWPHAALYIGTQEQRANIGIRGLHQGSEENIATLEALKDGVRFRTLASTLSVDSCVIIRPKLNTEQVKNALERAITHEGKAYDFEFDFRRSDKLVCTEVPYRAYHGCGNINFSLSERAGRLCLSAEDLLDHSLDGSFFDLVALYGYRRNRLFTGKKARLLLKKSYQTN